MINVNGKIVSTANVSLENNRGFLYGDAVFETLRILDNKVLFLEDHYFRLMSSMRILRMQIPMDFTMEFFQEEIIKLVQANNQSNHNAFKVRFTVYRDGEGRYLPNTRNIGYIATYDKLNEGVYKLNESDYEVELFKDFYVTAHLLSNLKTTNRLINVTGSIFAQENGYENCLLVNDSKNIAEALNANLFVVKDNVIKTPPLTDGCVKGIMRKQVMELIEKHPDYTLEEASISPFELQKADEMFLTNAIIGIQPITKYRKKSYTNEVAKDLINRLNAKIRFL
ncbi:MULTISPECIES: aminotransferase class IV [Myroides]|uniref:branched-chain-amino-acid transaminase n=1 Tax=Myroides albus TaxID=2562892 RepID=A0A6I3LGY8_9FLAO|nr:MULTISPECIES: aminotransferase class IV [Myroides]MTG97758.1 aminotransferase class IV [Myroides albus]MVX37036.1 aminotransferase class IV [Myroides sp. LoEW2-1]UVD78693.1 aminotransferase class IV [Myroides albus]